MQNQSEVTVIANQIFSNFRQGITIKDTASGYMQANRIGENLMANISVGGSSMNGTVILKNEIFGSRCEGVFLLQCDSVRIFQNKVVNNLFGVLSVNSFFSI